MFWRELRKKISFIDVFHMLGMFKNLISVYMV